MRFIKLSRKIPFISELRFYAIFLNIWWLSNWNKCQYFKIRDQFIKSRSPLAAELQSGSYVNKVNGGAPVTAGCRRPISELADWRQCVWGSASRRCLKNNVSSLTDVKKDICLFSPRFFCLPDRWRPCTLETANNFPPRGMHRTWVRIFSRFSSLPDTTHESPFRATGLWTRVLANDVYGFHAWQSECLRSLKISLPGVRPRTPGAPAALLRPLPHIPCPRLAWCWAFPAWKLLSWQRVLWPLSGLRLPRHGEHASTVCLHVLPAQQSQQQQQQQSDPQQIRTDR